jgi:[NiFe] hydrogenase large subunit/hydrogenase large subunit
VVPSTWNAGPRDASGAPGPYEAALVGTPVADPEQPLEILRTVHSFDPCMACGVHVVDARRHEIVHVRAR